MGKPCPKPAKRKKSKRARNPNSRKALEKRLEDAIRELVWWRDAGKCIEKDIDGDRCGGEIQWGHFIPRKSSRWLKFVYYNTFCQCRDHNGLHAKNDQTMGIAVAQLLGREWMLRLNNERDDHRDGKVYVEDLRARLQIVEMLLEHRPSFFDIETLVKLGYYGPWN